MANTLKEVLEDCIIYGDFLTTSFESSKFFMYLENKICEEDFLKLVIEEMDKKHIFEQFDVIAGLSWVSSSLLLAKYFSNKKNKRLSIIDSPISPPLRTDLIMPNIRGYCPKRDDRVLIIVDIISSGESLQKGFEVVNNSGAKPTGFAIVDRSKTIKDDHNKYGVKIYTLFKWEDFEIARQEHEEIRRDWIAKQSSKINKLFNIKNDNPCTNEIESKNDKAIIGFISINKILWADALEKLSLIGISEQKLKEWIRQFRSVREKEIALKLILKIRYIDESMIKAKFSGISDEINLLIGENIINEDIHFISLCPPGKNRTEPLHLYGNYWKGNYNNHSALYFKDFAQKKCIVFITDFIGFNGKEVLTEIDRFKEIPNSLAKNGSLTREECEIVKEFVGRTNKYLVAISGFESGVKQIQNSTGIICKVGYLLNENDKAFAINDDFPTKKEAFDAKRLIETIGMKLFRNGPLGVENDEALVVFSFDTPENTLPIFWKYGTSEFEWMPLFPNYSQEELLKITKYNPTHGKNFNFFEEDSQESQELLCQNVSCDQESCIAKDQKAKMKSTDKGEKKMTETYINFDLHIAPNGHAIANSPEGQAPSDISIEPPNEIKLALKLIEQRQTNIELLKQVGESLYNWLFPSAIHTHFQQTEAVARRDKAKLRLRLRVEPETIANLPLEFLYRAIGGYYLAVNPDTVLSRYLNLPLPPERVRRREGPLNMLAIIADPIDQVRLDPDEWEKIINAALEKPLAEGKITLKTVKHATRKKIRAALLDQKPDIIQFVGHGMYKDGKGYLALVNEETDKTWLVDDERFANLYMGYDDNLGLICLATCESAQSDNPQAFLGIAPKLVQRGVPAVVAMQYEVYINTAKVFLDDFYTAIAARKPIDWAIQSGRNAISLEFGLHNREFATPVLYMRATDGIVF